MSAIRFVQPTPAATSRQAVQPTAGSRTRHTHRERDFGIGYGNSSGYASARRYVDTRAQPRFRCI